MSPLLAASLLALDAHPSFAGAWQLDLAASESPEELLKAWGTPWAVRKAAANLSVTQTITQDEQRLAITIHAVVMDSTEVLPLDGGWATSTTKEGEPVRTRTWWAGDDLWTTSEVTRADGSHITLQVDRRLEDNGATMRQRLILLLPDGAQLAADRVFHRT
jgi:hypothetical protein